MEQSLAPIVDTGNWLRLAVCVCFASEVKIFFSPQNLHLLRSIIMLCIIIMNLNLVMCV